MSEYIIDTFGIVQDFANLRGDRTTPLYQAIMDVMVSRQREEIVRCKDCKYFNTLKEECFAHWEEGVTEGIAFSVTPDDFCSWGEPKGR